MRIGRGRRSADLLGVRLLGAAQLNASTPEVVVDLALAAELDLVQQGATGAAARALAQQAFPPSLTAYLAGGRAVDRWARRLVEVAPAQAQLGPGAVHLLCPVDPPSYRDFMCFEDHVTATYALAGRTPPAVLQERPAYYKGSTATLLGDGDTVFCPPFATGIDYELEVAFVIGRDGCDLGPDEAMDHVYGITVLNDFSARDFQFSEMQSRLGPAKGKDFATAVGPWVVTLDELDPTALAVRVEVNGEVRGQGNTASAAWTPAEIVAWASTAEPLRPGDLLGYGAVGGCTGLERGRTLDAGDLVELYVEGIGSLANVVGPRVQTGYLPVPRVTAPAGGG